MISWIISTIFCLLCGYIWGKAVGNKSGEQATKAMIPLLLRQESLEKGYCVLCHRIICHKIKIETTDRQKIITDSLARTLLDKK